MDIYYINSQGEKLDLVTYPYLMLSDTDLFDYTWSKTTKGTSFPRISSFSRSMVQKKIKIRVKGLNDQDYLNNIEKITTFFDADVVKLSPGRLYVDNYYLDCYIFASSKSSKYLMVNNSTVQFTLLSPDGNWKTSNIFHFGKSTSSDVDNGMPSTNIALKKSVTASGYENAASLPMSVVDGNLGTRWSSNFADDAWVAIDLGEQYYLESIKIYWETAYATNYNILVSNDGISWSTLKSMRNMSGGTDEIVLEGVNYYRFIKFQGITRALPAYGYSIYEFEVYGKSTSPFLDYPLDYLYDYTNDIRINSLTNDGYAASDFKLTIYGKCSDPLISIGDWNYGATDVDLSTGEKLIIDSVNKKVYKITVTGAIENLFSHRLKDFYAFQKIAVGQNIVGWNGAYEFDIELFEDRSEPKWT